MLDSFLLNTLHAKSWLPDVRTCSSVYSHTLAGVLNTWKMHVTAKKLRLGKPWPGGTLL